MKITPENIHAVTHIQIPEYFSRYVRHKSLLIAQLVTPSRIVPCVATALQTYNKAVVKISCAFEGGLNLIVTKKLHGELFENASAILLDDNPRIEGATLVPSKKSTWHSNQELPAEQYSSEVIRDSWRDSLSFKSETRDTAGKIVRKGLRSPQIGALHAIAAHWSVSQKSGLVVMPTGTGKTEVMLAATLMQAPKRLLVLMPTDALRTQTFNKFSKFGLLREIGAARVDIINPICGMSTGHITSSDIITLKDCNVVISTVAAIQNLDSKILKSFCAIFDTVFFDEAHHVPATSWQRIFDSLGGSNVIQFTATPFRMDGQRMPGRIIYDFPLRLAQSQGYFRTITFKDVCEVDSDDADIKIAELAIRQLRDDDAAGFRHLILARVNTIERATQILAIYARLAPDLNPGTAHSRMKGLKEMVASIQAGLHRIIVCVDMFGEGFDLPALKIAALHNPHRSLGVTLQFTGRFTRDAEGIGNPTLIANTFDPGVSEAIEELYSENSDWNTLIPELSSKAIQSQVAFSDFLDRIERSDREEEELFDINILRPKTSTVIYKATSFNSRNLKKRLSKATWVERTWHSKDKDLLIFITKSAQPIEWARIKETTHRIWDLYIVAYEQESGLLFIYSSQKGTLHPDLAKVLTGNSACLVSGEKMFRALSKINRLIFFTMRVYTTKVANCDSVCIRDSILLMQSVRRFNMAQLNQTCLR